MCVCALGSRDNGVSVWLTGFLRPVVVMENLFSGPVLDLAWSSVGYHLLACSFDGTVALLKFTENEIGKSLSKEQKVILSPFHWQNAIFDPSLLNVFFF